MRNKRDRPFKILIVDDNQDFRDALKEFLTFGGHQIQEASDGKKALDLLRAVHDIDLVLLDISMPGLSGLEVLAEIKKVDPKLSVIILTCHCAKNIAAYAPEGLAQGYIEKIADPDKIRKMIEKVLAGS